MITNSIIQSSNLSFLMLSKVFSLNHTGIQLSFSKFNVISSLLVASFAARCNQSSDSKIQRVILSSAKTTANPPPASIILNTFYEGSDSLFCDSYSSSLSPKSEAFLSDKVFLYSAQICKCAGISFIFWKQRK